jgi:hypothetical protein
VVFNTKDRRKNHVGRISAEGVGLPSGLLQEPWGFLRTPQAVRRITIIC